MIRREIQKKMIWRELQKKHDMEGNYKKGDRKGITKKVIGRELQKKNASSISHGGIFPSTTIKPPLHLSEIIWKERKRITDGQTNERTNERTMNAQIICMWWGQEGQKRRKKEKNKRKKKAKKTRKKEKKETEIWVRSNKDTVVLGQYYIHKCIIQCLIQQLSQVNPLVTLPQKIDRSRQPVSVSARLELILKSQSRLANHATILSTFTAHHKVSGSTWLRERKRK